MFKLKFYLWNAFYSSLIGLVVHIIGLVIWIQQYSLAKFISIILQNPYRALLVLLINLVFSMAVGVVIGTVSLFFFFQIFLKLTQKPIVGFLSNFTVVAVLNIAGAVMTGFRSYQLFIDNFFSSLWFVALIVSEVLSLFLTFLWRRRIMLYKIKLEEKKASLRS